MPKSLEDALLEMTRLSYQLAEEVEEANRDDFIEKAVEYENAALDARDKG